jgi:hypothetical protein
VAAAKNGAAHLGAHLVFLDESGFLLIPTVRRTWAPRGQTPVIVHALRRDRISTVSALAVSPQYRRLALYLACRTRNLTGRDTRAFLQALRRHLPGPVVLLWDRGTIHRETAVTHFLRRHRRVQAHFFPAYAPELNPAEFVWTQADGALANGAPRDVAHLYGRLQRAVQRIRGPQQLLWSCLHASDLPWRA